MRSRRIRLVVMLAVFVTLVGGIAWGVRMAHVPPPTVPPRMVAAYHEGYRAVWTYPDGHELDDRPCHRAWRAHHPNKPESEYPRAPTWLAFYHGCMDHLDGRPPSVEFLISALHD